MDIRRIFTALKRWLWLLVLGALIVGGVGYYISNQETPMYQASTRFVIMRAATTGYDYYAYLDYQQLITTYTQLLSTDALLAQVSDVVGFPVYAGQANAEQIGDTQFVRLTVTHQDPVKAATIANALVSVLIGQNEQLQSVRYETTKTNLQNRANQALDQIEILQNQIEDLSTETLQGQIVEVQSQIEELQIEVTDLEVKIANIDSLIATQEEILQKFQYQADLNQLKPLLEMYQEIYTQLVVMGEPIQNENAASTQMERLERTLDLYEQIYFSSLSSLETINLTQAQSTPNVVQVEPATVPQNQFTPRPMRTAGLYGVVGFIAMAGLAFLIEYLDDTVKTPDDVKNILDLPVIGLVADMNGKGLRRRTKKRSVFVVDKPRSPITEAFRSLRTSLEFYSVDQPLKMIVVTSPGPEEGKTTIATNLAVILARGSKKVLLLDADMRRPNIHSQLDIRNRIGLSDLIRKRLSYSDVLQVSSEIENLSVITSGSLPPNPSELLNSNRMNEILHELESDFDLIVIDTPPAIVTDAQILATKVDGVIYVLKAGKTRAMAAQKPLEEFQRVGAQVIGVVMNRIPHNRGYFYGGFSYYSPGTENSGKYYRSEEIKEFQSVEEDVVNAK